MNRRTPFGLWLELRRHKLGLSIEELSERIDCAPQEIEAFETGGRQPSRRIARAMARHFRVSPAEQPAFVLFAISDLDEELAPDAVGIDDPESPWRVRLPLRTKLPSDTTSFVGRDFDLVSVVALLTRPTVRLLTLTGPPGIGKTRLSQQVASHMTSHFPDGVFFVSLAPIFDPSLVASTIAQVVEAKEVADETPIETLKQYLRGREVLLVLDNFEHVLDAGPLVAELLATCDGLKIMVTSREALHVYGEQLYHVPPLRLPQKGVELNASAIAQWDSVELFVQRARSVKPDLVIDDASAKPVAEICRRLDGLPLAIELAAAYSNILSPADILSRLDNRLKLLTGGGRDLSPRHKTLREAIAWSYDLLDQEEKRLFCSLSVFVDGCTTEALDRVISLTDDTRGGISNSTGSHSRDALDLLRSLVGKSLLQQEGGPGGQSRYSMLETIREYGLERLSERREAAAARRAHARFMLEFAEKAEPHLPSADRAVWLLRLDAELDNLRAALVWSQSEEGDAELGMRLAGALHWYWHFKGSVNEASRWLDSNVTAGIAQVVNRSPNSEGGLAAGPNGPTVAKIVFASGRLAEYFRDQQTALPLLQASLGMFRRLGDERSAAYALMPLARIKAHANDLEAQNHAAEGVATFRRLGDRWGLAYALDIWGDITWVLGDLAHAAELKKESYNIYFELGDTRYAAYELGQVGLAEMQLGDLALSRSCLDQAATISRQVRDEGTLAVALRGLGMLAQLSGDYVDAETYYGESVLLYTEMGDRLRKAATTRNLGHVAVMQGKYEQALSMYTESLAICRDIGNERGVALALAGFAGLAGACSNSGVAAKLLASALPDGSVSYTTASSSDLAFYSYPRAMLDAALGEVGKEEFSGEEKAFDLERAIVLAQEMSLPSGIARAATRASLAASSGGNQSLAEEDLRASVTSTAGNKSAQAGRLPGGISKREADLLRLVALGMSNAEIAAKLVLSQHTVRAHLYSIYAKLNVTSRTAAARFAIDNGLA